MLRATMRVTHISIIHKSLDTRIFEKECRALADAGYEVHLIVAGAPAREIGGVRLHSVDVDDTRPPLRRQGARLFRATRRAFALWPSIYHVHDAHLIPLGAILKVCGAHVVYDVHEDYPAKARSNLLADPWRRELKAFLWKALEWLARRAFDGFVCASPTIADKFPAASTKVVHNFPLRRTFELAGGDPPPTPYRRRPNKIVYTGYVSEIRGFWEVARALELLPSDLHCHLQVIGAFRPPQLESAAQALPAWSRMRVMPWQHHPVVVRELRSARIGLTVLHPLPNHDDAIRSNKLFEYMAAAIPVVGPDFPRWREIVHGVGCGLVVDPVDPASIAGAIEHLLRHPEEAEAMGRRGRAAVQEQFNWDGEAQRLLSLYGRLANGRLPPLQTAPA